MQKKGNEPRDTYAWWHGYNRGWLKTNDKGQYEINTIKPAPYPARIEPAHIHVVVKAPTQKEPYDIGAITFKGDDLATTEYWYKVEQNGHPRDGGVSLKKNRAGVWEGKMNYVLYAQYDIASGNSGLLPGEECPAFSPVHVFGQDKGSKACPMCKYGYKQGLMAWINTTDDWSEIRKLSRFLEDLISKKGLANVRAFIIYMNKEGLPPGEVNAKLTQFAKDAALKNVALLYIPAGYQDKAYSLYRINANKEIENTVFVYKNRHVAEKYINFKCTDENLKLLFSSLNKAIASK